MSADGLISEFKRLLSAKCGLPANKVCFVIFFLLIYTYCLSFYQMIAYKIRGNRTVDLLKDDDRATATGYSWNNSDIIYV